VALTRVGGQTVDKRWTNLACPFSVASFVVNLGEIVELVTATHLAITSDESGFMSC
jgi:hypothetical protein